MNILRIGIVAGGVGFFLALLFHVKQLNHYLETPSPIMHTSLKSGGKNQGLETSGVQSFINKNCERFLIRRCRFEIQDRKAIFFLEAPTDLHIVHFLRALTGKADVHIQTLVFHNNSLPNQPKVKGQAVIRWGE